MSNSNITSSSPSDNDEAPKVEVEEVAVTKSEEEAIADKEPMVEEEISKAKLSRLVAKEQKIAARKQRKTEKHEALNETRMGRIWYGVIQRTRFPKKNTWRDFANIEKDATNKNWIRRYHYRAPAVLITGLLLFIWGMMYMALSQSIGGIRLNSFILEDAIADGTAYAVNAVGDDGSLVGRDGATYPPGSIDTNAVVQAKFGFPFYSPEGKVLLIPYDWTSVFKGGAQIWVWVASTFVLFMLDKLMVTRFTNNKHGMKYHEAIYSFYPRSLRIVRWVIILIMIFCVGFLLWPLI